MIKWLRSAGWLLALGALAASLLAACGGSGPKPPVQDNKDDMPGCYPPLPITSGKAISPQDQSLLADRYHDLGIIGDSAHAKLSERDNKSA